MMKTVLVTGDTGLVGRKIVSELKKQNFKVIGLSRHPRETDYETIECDITDGSIRLSGLDHIIHLAADTECVNEKSCRSTNVEGTRSMLDIAKINNVKSFVYISTGGVYGFGERPFSEGDKPMPHNFYSATKYEAEILCRQYVKYFPVTILRYFFPYGPSEKDRLINRLVGKIKNGQPVELNESGAPMINPVAAGDAARATVAALQQVSDYEVFNIAGEETVNILDLVRIIEKQLGVRAEFVYNGKKTGNMIGDISKARRLLKFTPKIKLEEGIAEIIRQ